MTKTPDFPPLTGRCRCEHVCFRIDAAPMITHACHCRSCQRSSGSAFAVNAMVETTHVAIVEGRTKTFQGAKNHKEVQCSECGCTLWVHRSDLGDAIAFVGVGMLDDAMRLQPEAHYFVRSKHPWVHLPTGVPAFDALGDPGKPGVRERVMAALAPQSIGYGHSPPIG